MRPAARLGASAVTQQRTSLNSKHTYFIQVCHCRGMVTVIGKGCDVPRWNCTRAPALLTRLLGCNVPHLSTTQRNRHKLFAPRHAV